jgi:hypothetical protein
MRDTVPLVHNEHWLPVFVWNERSIANIQLDKLTAVNGQTAYLAHAVTHSLVTATAVFNDVLAQIG